MKILRLKVILIILVLTKIAHAQNPLNLGPQVFYSQLEDGSRFITDENGKTWLYTILNGAQGRLLGYDLVDYSLKVNLPLVQMEGSWDIAMSTDGWLYIAGSSGGRLARHRLGSQTIQDLGRPIASETYLWALAAGKNGEIFGATYPNCRVFRYHPSTGFSDVGNGAIKEGENYVRSLVYHEETDKLYAGIGSHSYLIELNPRTGTKTEILPEIYQGQNGFVYDLNIVKGLTGGDRLIGILNKLGKTFVYNLNTKTYENEIPRAIAVKPVLKSQTDERVYFTMGNGDLYHYSITQMCPRAVKIVTGTKRSLAMKWINNNELLILNSDARLLKCNINSKELTDMNITVPSEAIRLQNVATGPDGKIWTGGFAVGNNAAYDPATGVTTPYNGLDQPEGIFTQGNKIYFGTYSRAQFYAYDVTRPWSLQNGNPIKIGQAAGQDRPFAGVSVPDHNKMFFGTVPDYGVLGGALMDYDVNNNLMVQYNDIVTNQSIVSMAYKSGEVFGGTSVWGGLGIQPTASSAKLFVWNVANKSKAFEITPVNNAKAITALMNGPDGNIWGMADGTLFIFNPVNRQVVYTKVLYQVSQQTKEDHVWRNANMILHSNGKIYGISYGEFFELNPATKTKTTISNHSASTLTMDANGHFYYTSSLNLWRYIP